ncbi:hypothetical protein RD110_15820 [Rhodoferax koreense]|uniref:Phage Gp37/Gp68 family protein n=1 Tax=Rhodoferax koreensis TaxID=1842727 RepID=A0A1P8JXK0_9BURK|nr:phage Gp37/Gp68 family protein [Rhodoferax koreense]APW38489.1 hypothetical protein RD110_15820 [Rhodoferax koreense]
MSAASKIEWTDSTLNWWEGCTKVGPGCNHCYAEARNARFGGGQSVNWGPGAPRRLTSEHNRNSLRRWNKREFFQCGDCGARSEGKPFMDFGPNMGAGDHGAECPDCGSRDMDPVRRRVFCSSLSDVFDNEVPQEWRDAFFAEMEAATNLDLLVLTKRIGNVRKMVPVRWLQPGGWPAHVWLGATIVNQPEADRDITKLLQVPARVRFLSMEPLLGAVNLTSIPVAGSGHHEFDPIITANVLRRADRDAPAVHWVIVGGESGPGARPMHPHWARSLRDQCESAGVPFLFKQWGEFAPSERTMAEVAKSDKKLSCVPLVPGQPFPLGVVDHVGKKAAGRMLDGRTWEGFPA